MIYVLMNVTMSITNNTFICKIFLTYYQNNIKSAMCLNEETMTYIKNERK